MFEEPILKLAPDGSGRIYMNSTMHIINAYNNLRCDSHKRNLTKEELETLQILTEIESYKLAERVVLPDFECDF
jgi:hypothetical protein